MWSSNINECSSSDWSYYNSYLLDDITIYDLSDKQKELLDNACMLVDNGYSLRQLSRNVNKSKSQLSRDFQKPLRKLSFELYQCVHRTYKKNISKYF